MRPPFLLLALLAALAAATATGQTPSLIDPTFRAELTVAPDLVVPLADGRIYVTSTRQVFTVAGHPQRGLARLRADGSIDPSFDVGSGIEAGTRINALDVLTDGRVALTGTFTTINGTTRPTLARLLASGALDPSFQPDATLLAPSPALRYPLLDGRWIVGTVANQSLTFARFSEAGITDSTYPPRSIDLRQRPSGAFNLAPSFNRAALLSRDSLGRGYLGARFLEAFGSTFEDVYRLNTSGELEPAILFSHSTPSLGTRDRASATAVEIDGQRAVIQSFRFLGGMIGGISIYGFSVRGLSPGGIAPVIPSYLSTLQFPQYTDVTFGFGLQARLGPDGIYTKSYGTRGRNGIVRLDFAGNLDPDFSCEIAEFIIPGSVPPGGPADFHLLANGQILLHATSINGTPTNFLVRLTPSRRAGATRLSNASVLARLPSGLQPLILGFVVANGRKNLLARATGPALAQFGVAGATVDPVLSVSGGSGVLAANDDWPASIADVGSAVGAFALFSGSRDAALSADHPADAYTIQVTDKTGTGGMTLGELYDLDPRPAGAANPRLVNFSARATVGAASGPLIAGFTLDGDSVRTVLIRAVGPGLAQFGLSGTIPDPEIRLYRGNAAIAATANWGAGAVTNTQPWGTRPSLLKEMFRAVRAFSLDDRQPDAALSATLPPGAYTVQVTSASNTPGMVMVEVYEVP